MANQDPNSPDNGQEDPISPEDLVLEDEPAQGANGQQDPPPPTKKKYDEMTKEELLPLVKQFHGRLAKKPPVKTAPTGQPAPTQSKEEVGDAGTRLSRLEEAEAKRKFGYENSLSPEETDRVFSITKNPTKETLKDPFIKAGLAAIRKEQRVTDATPSPSGRARTFNGKTFAEMDEKERKAAYESRTKG